MTKFKIKITEEKKRDSFRFFTDPERKRKAEIRKGRMRSAAILTASALALSFLAAAFPGVSQTAYAASKTSLPGIETLKSNLAISSQKSLRILEIVPEGTDAAFGYYISGQEPTSIEDKLRASVAIQPDGANGIIASGQRVTAANAYIEDLKTRGILGDQANYPLSYKAGTEKIYEEYYPWDNISDEDRNNGYAHLLVLDEPEIVGAAGTYSQAVGGKYSIDPDKANIYVNSNGSHAQNLKVNGGVTFTAGNSASLEAADFKDYVFYKPEFVPVRIMDIDGVPVVYNADGTAPLTGKDGKYIFQRVADTDSDGNPCYKYKYFGEVGDTDEWEMDAESTIEYVYLESLALGGENPVLGKNLNNQQLASYRTSGWYVLPLSMPFNEVDYGKLGKYFTLDLKGFAYVGEGNGGYNLNLTNVGNPNDFWVQFTVSYSGKEYVYRVDNNDLFLKHVLDYDETDDLAKASAGIQVDAVNLPELTTDARESDLSKKGQHYAIQDYDLIVINKEHQDDAGLEVIFNEGVYDAILEAADNDIAIICDPYEQDGEGNQLEKLVYALQTQQHSKSDPVTTETDGTYLSMKSVSYWISPAENGYEKGWVDGNIYFYDPATQKPLVSSGISEDFNPGYYTASGAAFNDVYEEIVYENFLRTRKDAGTTDLLDTNVHSGRCIRYILNRQHRKAATKDRVRILEIEPDNHSQLNTDENAYPAGKTGLANDTVLQWFGGKYEKENIEIATMSTYEFVGKINDVTEDYDLVYIGSDITDFNTKNDYETYYDYAYDNGKRFHLGGDGKWWALDSKPHDVIKRFYQRVDGRVEYYSDTGVVNVPVFTKVNYTFGVEWYNTQDMFEWTGMTQVRLNSVTVTDFNDNNMDGLIYYNIGDTCWNIESENRATGLLENEYNNAVNAKGFEMRYSGNDLTKKKVEELEKFARGSYPVILADELLQYPIMSENQKTDNAVSTEHVDINSKIYGLLDSIWQLPNVYTSSSAGYAENNANMLSYLSLSKPEIDLKEAPKEYTEAGDHNVIANRTLRFKFAINNDTDPNPGATTYSLHLFVDQNGDGLTANEEEISELVLKQNGQDVRTNALTASGSPEYVLTRELPPEIKGIIPWKLVIEENGGGYHASKTGYAYTPVKAAEGDTGIKVNILQINIDKNRPDSLRSDQTYLSDADSKKIGTRDTYSLEWQNPGENASAEEKAVAALAPFGKLFKQIREDGDYDIKITTKTVDEVNTYYNTSNKADTACDMNSVQNGYNMIIIGFGDAYGELRDNTSVAITEFIDSGKAVLFSHDNTAPCNSKQYFDINPGRGHGYYFNTIVRDSVGLDKYGITNKDPQTVQIVHNQWNKETVNFTLGGAGSQANNWKDGILYDMDTTEYPDEQENIIKSLGYDVAYQPKSVDPENAASAKGQNVKLAQGMTDLYLEGMSAIENGTAYPHRFKYEGIDAEHWVGNNAGYGTDRITLENKGQITKYPFDIEADPDPKDGREYLTVGSTHLQYYQLNMNSDDIVVWYCLGRKSDRDADLYSKMPNDVANGYYIYSRGNITYSGCGDGGAPSHWNDPTEDEAKLFINTMIASFRAGYQKPSLGYLTDENGEPLGGDGASICLPAENVMIDNGEDSADAGIVTSAVKAPSGRLWMKIADKNLAAGKKVTLADMVIHWDPFSMDVPYWVQEDGQWKNELRNRDFPEANISISESGIMSYTYWKNGGEQTATSSEALVFHDAEGNPVANGELQTGKSYYIDLSELYAVYSSTLSGPNEFAKQKGHSLESSYIMPPSFPTTFTLRAKPITRFSNGATEEGDPKTLTVSTLEMLGIG